MIVRAVVSVKVDGVLLQRYPLIRRVDNASLSASRSTTVAPSVQATIIPNTIAKRVRAVRVHEPVTLQFPTAVNAFPLRSGLFMVFDENFSGDTQATNPLTTPVNVDTYHAA